jgi:predicted ATPase
MIKYFEVKNFKCHEDNNEFKIPGFTIVSGTNNSGKSSLLQAIYLLTQNKSIRYPVLSLNEELGLGTFSDVLNKKQPSFEKIELSIDFDECTLNNGIFEELLVTYSYINPSNLQNISISYQEENPLLFGIKVNFKKVDSEDYESIEIELVDQKGTDIIFYKVSGVSDNGFCKISNNVPDPILYEDFERKNKVMISSELDEVRNYLLLLNKDNIKYLKAFRLDNFSIKNNSINRDLGLSGEYTAEIINQKWNTKVDLENNRTGEKFEVFSKAFDFWIRELLGQNYKIRSISNENGSFKIVVLNTITNFEFGLSQVGFGISQILPIVTLLLTSKENDLLLIENPEVHLHPKLQSIFVDLCLFILANNRKVIVETHSEHIINRLRLRIKENPELLLKQNILFFEQSEGEFTYTDIHVDKNGKIDYWPKNFFDQTYNDLLGLIDID